MVSYFCLSANACIGIYVTYFVSRNVTKEEWELMKEIKGKKLPCMQQAPTLRIIKASCRMSIDQHYLY